MAKKKELGTGQRKEQQGERKSQVTICINISKKDLAAMNVMQGSPDIDSKGVLLYKLDLILRANLGETEVGSYVEAAPYGQDEGRDD